MMVNRGTDMLIVQIFSVFVEKESDLSCKTEKDKSRKLHHTAGTHANKIL